MATLRDRVIEIATNRFPGDMPPAGDSYVDEVEQSILNFTNLDTVPDGLLYVWVSMLVDCWRWVSAVASVSTGVGEDDSLSSPTSTFISSVHEGDVTVGYTQRSTNTVDNPGAAHDMRGALDQIVSNYESQLKRYRTVLY